nr:uncharacterized protein CI109_000224 [Kwoniella shandongensis]KAA5531383.1 hypothetical protein CI109_000224 [Kwoniella shandongensis]
MPRGNAMDLIRLVMAALFPLAMKAWATPLSSEQHTVKRTPTSSTSTLSVMATSGPWATDVKLDPRGPLSYDASETAVAILTNETTGPLKVNHAYSLVGSQGNLIKLRDPCDAIGNYDSEAIKGQINTIEIGVYAELDLN